VKQEGARAEALAAEFLERRGLRVEERNYRCRQGEIDLVCRDGATLVFVEVRLRRGSGFGGAAESITRQKQHRIILAAQHYLAKLGKFPPCRFDAVLLSGTDPGAIEWIRDAFTA
jgi:putative endonuclease